MQCLVVHAAISAEFENLVEKLNGILPSSRHSMTALSKAPAPLDCTGKLQADGEGGPLTLCCNSAILFCLLTRSGEVISGTDANNKSAVSCSCHTVGQLPSSFG